MIARRLALAAALAALVPALARADSLSCAGGIVSLGDSKLDLLGKCGRPALQERDVEERSLLDARLGVGRRVVSPVERWTYDFGRSHFIQVVRLVAGKVAGVERGGYGYAQAAAPRERLRRATCEPAALDEGALALEILSRCGEPAVVDAWDEELRAVEEIGGEKVVTRGVIVTIEVWTYDFGRNQFLRFVRVEGGKVTRVDTGSYGYAD